jgi:hypothetical protein
VKIGTSACAYACESGIYWPKEFEAAHSGAGITGSVGGLGAPCAPMQQVAGPQGSEAALFYREYQRGAVLVNASAASSFTFTLPAGAWTWKDIDDDVVAADRTVDPIVFNPGNSGAMPDSFHAEIYFKIPTSGAPQCTVGETVGPDGGVDGGASASGADASVEAPDAAVEPPDASLGAPDAAVGAPDSGASKTGAPDENESREVLGGCSCSDTAGAWPMALGALLFLLTLRPRRC